MLTEVCDDSVVPAMCTEGCEVEPDGRCSHGCPSPLVALRSLHTARLFHRRKKTCSIWVLAKCSHLQGWCLVTTSAQLAAADKKTISSKTWCDETCADQRELLPR